MRDVNTDSKALVQVFHGAGKAFTCSRHPLPARLGRGEVLVQMRLATICGSDLHTVKGLRQEPVPAVLGHEGVGTVVAMGDGAEERASVGDRVVWSIADSCGKCAFCTTHGMPQKCVSVFKYGHASLGDGSGLNGCYATHIVLRPGTHICHPADNLADAVVAPANCALATIVNAVSHIPNLAGARVLVQGAGLLGVYACAVLRESGVESVFCTDLDATRRALSERFGAQTLSPEDISDQRQLEKHGAAELDAVIEVAGTAAVVADGVRLLRPGGRYVFAGMVHPATELPLTGEQIIRKCLTLCGVHNYAPHHLDEALSFLQRTAGRYPYEALVSPPVPLTDLEGAMAAAEGRRYLRIAVHAGNV